MHLTNKFDKGIRFLLCVIDISVNIISLKDKKDITITNATKKNLRRI